MKKEITLLVLSFLLIFGIEQSKAQTTGININLYASQYPCNNPVQYTIGASFHYFPIGTVMNINLDFGDGNNYTSTYTIINPIYDTLLLTLNHTYALAGTYMPITTIIGGGVTETLTGIVYGSLPGTYPITVSSPSNCGNVSGKVYHDINTNCVIDPGEELQYMYVEIDSAGTIIQQAITDMTGNYSINYQYTPGITYVVKFSYPWFTSSCYTTVCPASLSYLVNTATATNLDFGLTTNGTSFDLESTSPMLQSSTMNHILTAGTNIYLVAYYKNTMCQSQYGDLVITLDPSINYLTANIPPTNVSGNTLTWSNLYTAPINWGIGDFIAIEAYLPFVNSSSVPFAIGDSVNVQTSFTPISGVDANPSNNQSSKWYYIGTAYDPNDKHVFPKGKGMFGDVGFGTEFSYDINFQNTGTAPAQQITIKDTLDASLDPTTVSLTSYSHHVVFTQSGNILTFQFPNIMLPDSASDFERSIGYLEFKVKHKSGLPPNKSIHNKASIYFDANPPIVTSNTKNRLVEPNGIDPHDVNNEIRIFPNPATDLLIVSTQSKSNPFEQIQLINSLGEIVYSNQEINHELKIDVSHITKGVYYLKSIQANREIKNRKVIIN